MRLSFLSGGPASGDIVTVRSRFDARTWPGFDSLPDYSFSVYQDDGEVAGGAAAVAPNRKVRTRRSRFPTPAQRG